MKTTLFAFFIICLAVGVSAGPIATFSPGNVNEIEAVSSADGQLETVSLGGRDAVRMKTATTPPSNYMYFKVSPEIRSKAGSDLYLVVYFYDEAMMPVHTEYNTEANAYSPGPNFLLTDTGKWQKVLLHLNNAKFAGSQNSGADFRFYSTGPIAVSGIELYTEDPKLNIASDKERLMSRIKDSPKLKNMYYTFGNDTDDTSAALFKSLGVTSIESYVTWETVEGKGEGQWDWSRWDDQVRILKENNLKWVPFLILGPAYSTPNWFRASSQHIPCRCLEHGTASKIESLWNPNLPEKIDRFISEFAKRYKDSGVIESVLLGIQGDFGEAIYSVTGGGWTFIIPGEYHNHRGFWCDDPYALADYRKFIAKKYKSANAVNKAWGTSFKNLEDVDFPGRKDSLDTFRERVSSNDPKARRQWLDFVDWYRDAMTEWSDWWIATTRKHFPKTPVYLCTGGDAIPEHGSNFAEQCRAAAKHKAGVRITNEASNYAYNFTITRWVASAGKHYGAYYGFEPAGNEDEKGIVARIYNATASGANQLHDYYPNVTSSKARIESQQKSIKHLFRVNNPVVPAALWYPNVSMTLKWGGYFDKAQKLRDYTDYDYVDETMLRTGALKHNKVLIILHGSVMETKDARIIADWVKKGGKLIVMDVAEFESVESKPEPENILFGKNSTAVRVNGWDALAQELERAFDTLGLPVCDLKQDNIFATQIGSSKFLLYNAGEADATIEIRQKDKQTSVKVPASSITEAEY